MDEDPEIPSQKYVLLSFLSPENVLPAKSHYFFQNFLKYYDVQWKTKKLEEFLAGQVATINKKLTELGTKLDLSGNTEAAAICTGGQLSVNELIEGFQAYVKKNNKEIQMSDIENQYKDFLFTHEKKLEDEFHAANEFRTTVRGLKVRGSYSTMEEAKVRAKKLQKVDDVHNIALGEVGKWLPWDPSSDQIKQEYAEDQLNELMHKYKDNEDQKNELFREARAKKNSVAALAGDNGLFGAVEDGADVAAADDSTADKFEPMFDGGDLVIARKQAAAETATATDVAETTDA